LIRRENDVPLTQQERIELEAIIRGEHKRLMAELREEIEQSRQETFGAVEGGVGDSADEAVADLLSDLDTAEITRDLGDIRALEAAMGRFAAGTYGRCADCGTDIPVARLRAQPAALRCVACQAVHEKTYAHSAEPKL
jgi:RNA polymerase-binding transcription factor DksA